MSLFDKVSTECSALIARQYSTSFSSAIRLLHRDLRGPVFSIYGFVRLADEIVDTFHGHDKEQLLRDFGEDTRKAIRDRISLNPVLHSFQETVHRFGIPEELIAAFLRSMALDLHKTDYTTAYELDEYIHGSAEVVGLMCLCVFCEGDQALYDQLQQAACRLGAAFQKVNFLRDIQSDYNNLHRTYFPGFDYYRFDETVKRQIEKGIENDFRESLEGLRRLPLKARFGVYTAYRYYYALFRKIRKMQPQCVLEQRVRVSDPQKLLIVLRSRMHYRLNLI